MTTATVADPVARARAWANLYRSMGYQPLPSDPNPPDGRRKKPLCKYADLWETEAQADLFDRFPTTNIQLMTGRRWSLAVLDFDGSLAIEHSAKHWPKLPRTWTTFHSRGGSTSRHCWFGLPSGIPERRKTILWQGEGKHEAIELLMDRSLVMAPPSVHPVTGNRYGFQIGPREMRRPAMLPNWVLRLPLVLPARETQGLTPISPRGEELYTTSYTKCKPTGLSVRHILDSLPDKVSIAKSWGLRFARESAESDGWVSVHDYDREDRNPSARFHVGTGGFWRPGCKVVPFCQLAADMGVYRDWKECASALAEQFNIR